MLRAAQRCRGESDRDECKSDYCVLKLIHSSLSSFVISKGFHHVSELFTRARIFQPFSLRTCAPMLMSLYYECQAHE